MEKEDDITWRSGHVGILNTVDRFSTASPTTATPDNDPFTTR